ncbi:MAG: lipase family protein, partial [Hyphomicrobiaceae bacterium]
MDKTKKYLAALDAPDPDSTEPTECYWPAAIPALADEKSDHPLDCQCLSNDSIGPYLTSLSDEVSARPNGNGRTMPVDFAALDRNWTAETYPLLLCEFLAYKAGLAYRSPRHIRHDLLGLDAKGRPYKDGVEQFAFFDTSQASSSVRHADTQAYVFVHAGTGYLIFRGTNSFSDWRTNLSHELTKDTYPHLDTVPQTLAGTPHPARHTGFAIAWGSVAPDIEAWVRDQLLNRRIDKIVLSGHSLGGAL